jgi:hypothetical protein
MTAGDIKIRSGEHGEQMSGVADDFNIVPHGNNGGFTIVVVKAA